MKSTADKNSFNNSSLIIIVLQFSVLTFSFSCQAPRTNPLDPLNPDYNFGTLEGTVQSISLPFQPIQDVIVSWDGSSSITSTDSDGRFRLDNVLIQDGNLVFSKPGYKTDTLFIRWGSVRRFFSQIFLNEIPLLDKISLYTVVTNRPSNQTTYEVFVEAEITDNDKDIDTIFISAPELSFKKSLAYNVTSRVYESKLTLADLNISDLEQTIGLDFFIIAKDFFQNEFNIGTGKIARVIKDEVTGLVPANEDTITSQPFNVSWDEPQLGFTYTYIIDIYTNVIGNPQLVFRKEDIDSGIASFLVEEQLPDGNYFWVITIVDRFLNRSVSKPAAFRIR